MNKRIDFSFLGGFPFDENTLAFMQDSYRGALGALAKLCGDKTILAGVEVNGGNVTAGWISYNGELIPFIGGAVAAQVKITETKTPATFEDNSVHDVEYVKVAELVAVGDFIFADLQRIAPLNETWIAGDTKDVYCDNQYLINNFDNNGFGLNNRKGWQVLSFAFPYTAGKVFVNYDPNDPLFATLQAFGGEKEHTLTQGQLPSVSLKMFVPDVNTTGADIVNPSDGVARAGDGGGDFNFEMRRGGGDGSAATLGNTSRMGSGEAHNNLQPYFVILKIVKL
jgi:microcystin-dependent protein